MNSKVLIEIFVFCLQCSVIIADQCGLKLITNHCTDALGWDEVRRSVMLCFSWENITCKVFERLCIALHGVLKISVHSVLCSELRWCVSCSGRWGEENRTCSESLKILCGGKPRPANLGLALKLIWERESAYLQFTDCFELVAHVPRVLLNIGPLQLIIRVKRNIWESVFSASSKRAPRRVCSCNGCTF